MLACSCRVTRYTTSYIYTERLIMAVTGYCMHLQGCACVPATAPERGGGEEELRVLDSRCNYHEYYYCCRGWSRVNKCKAKGWNVDGTHAQLPNETQKNQATSFGSTIPLSGTCWYYPCGMIQQQQRRGCRWNFIIFRHWTLFRL